MGPQTRHATPSSEAARSSTPSSASRLRTQIRLGRAKCRHGRETCRYGLIPPVVMEFPGITVGGGFAGTSGESISFKHGFFDRTVEWIEIVLANGDVTTASHTENADLFYGAACSFGTLGVITLRRLQLVEDRMYVLFNIRPVFKQCQRWKKLRWTTQSTVSCLVPHTESYVEDDGQTKLAPTLVLSVSHGLEILGFTFTQRRNINRECQ